MTNQSGAVRLITISRQFGAGGRFVGERIAQALGWKLWDQELIHEVARVAGISESELAKLDEQESRSTLWERLRGRPSHRAYLAALKEWMDQIGEEGRAVIIGRGAPILLRYRWGAIHLRLVAPLENRVQRACELEPTLDREAARAKCEQMDEQRGRYVKYFFGEDVANPLSYHATINTAQLTPATTADMMIALAMQGAGTGDPNLSSAARTEAGPRIMTITSEIGARETDLARELARRLKLTLWDREALAREAGVSDTDEPDVTVNHPKEFEALRRVMGELAQRGDVLLVGHGGLEFLKEIPSALRLKLIAPMEERLRRVVEFRWLDARSADAVIAESDARRTAFYEKHFGINWRDPLRYDLVLNTAALGPRTADLVVQAAHCKWYGRAANAGPAALPTSSDRTPP